MTLEQVIRDLARNTTSANQLTDREVAYWRNEILKAVAEERNQK